MFACETPILQRLAVLVMCHGFAVGQTTSHYFLTQTPMPWSKAREYCQRYYVDLVVLNTEEQYFALLNTTHANKSSFWLGLQRQDLSSAWTWVNREELSYDHWYKMNYEGHCASLEAMLETEKKLLPRYCEEPQRFICQGPVAPQLVAVDTSDNQLNLSWNVSIFMQMTPHSYNVTICNASTCDTLLYNYTNGPAINISISNLIPDTQYFISISALIGRPDSVTGDKTTLRSNPTALQVDTMPLKIQSPVIKYILKFLKIMSLAPPLWILCCILKKDKTLLLYDDDTADEVSSLEFNSSSTDDTIIDLLPEKPEELTEDRQIFRSLSTGA